MLDIPIIDYNRPSSFGSLELQSSPTNENIGQIVDYQKTQKVPLISIDSLQLERIDFIKIDVEGMELSVLTGALESIKRHKPIMTIEILKSNQQEIINLLAPLNYKFFPMGINLLAVHQDDPTIQNIN
ncbi:MULTISPECIES: FkbM family methyltransferase [Rodentibacter]|uniref:FkbM family methyltransferase n=1 Tax=Rodentibacter TaxID=1960084 RepID=UPI002085F637|nr:FkbM family methyltransferase [Rodentibacter sp. JRC1]GJI56692.1 hypothetical protein HEMROJRC1_18040 [Rodentibacter sp. JRC1]